MKKIIFILLILLFIFFLIYWGYGRYLSQENWRESVSLVKLWPRLQKEKIESISFCEAVNMDTGAYEDNSFYELIERISFCVRNANVVKSWHVHFDVPKENLQECIQLIDKTMKNTKPIKGSMIPVWMGRMLIVTDKGKYLVHVETDISDVSGPKVYGEEWMSYELGKFLAKYCFPGHEFKFKYGLPSKEQTVAILLYPSPYERVPPLAIFGDKKLAEKLIFEPDVKDDPNGIKGITNLYKTVRLCKFGVKSREEAGKYIFDKELEPEQIFEDRDRLEKIMDAYEAALKEAEKREKYFPMKLDNPIGRIVFMTPEKDYWKEIGIGDNSIYDDYIKSEQLKAYFDELGLTKELLAGEPNKAPQN